MQIEKMKWITREFVQANPLKVFLFGDNLERVGMGGQAGAMRGEPNAVGIPTKKTPSMDESAFFTDDEFEENCKAIDAALMDAWQLWLDYVATYCTADIAVVIPSDGLGTGLAELDKRAPRTFAYLEQCLRDLENQDESY